MRPEERDPAHLWDMLEAAKAIARYASGRSFEDYGRDALRRDAIERQFIVLGEAARRLSESFRSAHSEIAWQGIIGLRNILIHRYEEVDDRLMWQRIETDLPGLMERLTRLLPPPPPGATE